MNRDRHVNQDRRAYRLWTPAALRRPSKGLAAVEAEDVAAWIVDSVRAWPRSVEDRQVSSRIGVPIQHVRLARRAR
ncbi:hypothetical protein OM076_28450 [Solirubrobacter ginsenosidimutans]|uniref:Uncharacterized protein n=1 Tax=Solirubrobacter ginsenosidimutans TaxID=490573 RepID=A0A9X3S267_9ACTN|nr:hypothetical protein [Solirubrobacter ginsenosidimutans]MDA0164235.1 hypothetical protein [Solirubrobacter ginsenosidimutans]